MRIYKLDLPIHAYIPSTLLHYSTYPPGIVDRPRGDGWIDGWMTACGKFGQGCVGVDVSRACLQGDWSVIGLQPSRVFTSDAAERHVSRRDPPTKPQRREQ